MAIYLLMRKVLRFYLRLLPSGDFIFNDKYIFYDFKFCVIADVISRMLQFAGENCLRRHSIYTRPYSKKRKAVT